MSEVFSAQHEIKELKRQVENVETLAIGLISLIEDSLPPSTGGAINKLANEYWGNLSEHQKETITPGFKPPE